MEIKGLDGKKAFRFGGILLFSLILSLSANAQARYRVKRKDHGFTNITQGSILIPSNQYPLGLGAETINGYQVNSQFSVGIGLGINIYQEDLFLPAFLDARFNFMEGNTPFLCADAGYALAFNDRQGGPIGHGGAGYKWYFSNTVALTFMVGYKVQRYRETILGQTGEGTVSRSISSPALTLGLSF